MNERTHFFIKIYLSHFILERVDFGCVWEVSWKRGQTATYRPKVLLTIAALLSHLIWGCSTVGHWGPKALCLPLALTLVSCPQLELTQAVCGTWLYNCLTSTCFRCSYLPQVHLLIDGSVEGQYVTPFKWILEYKSLKANFQFIFPPCLKSLDRTMCKKKSS